MKLFKEIEKNQYLKFIDTKSKEIFKFSDILFDTSQIYDKNKQLVFLYCKNQLSSIGIYFSLLQGNFTIALLNEELSTNFKISLEELYLPSIIIDESRVKLRSYSTYIVKSNYQKLQLFIKNYNNENTLIHSKIKLLLSTSGTTGSPKFVKLSEENIYQNAISISSYLPIKNNDVVPLNLPIFYSYGLSVLHSNALNGGEIICSTSDILTKEFWHQFEEFGFSTISGVPFIYEMLDRIGFRKKHYPTLRYLTQAGGNLSQKVKKFFLDYCQENKLELFIMYGQTEATARISFVPPNKLKEKITSIGLPILNGKLSIENNTNELIYEGPNVFGGYAKNLQDLFSWDEVKKLYTGDLATKDEEGFYFITGRMKRFVKITGNRLNLDEIESIFKNKVKGIDLACIGVNDKNVIIITSKEVNIQNLIKEIAQELKIHSSIFKHYLIKEIPLTSNKKINYKELKNLFESKNDLIKKIKIC